MTDIRPVRIRDLPFALVTREGGATEYQLRARFAASADAFMAMRALRSGYGDEDIAVLDFSGDVAARVDSAD